MLLGDFEIPDTEPFVNDGPKIYTQADFDMYKASHIELEKHDMAQQDLWIKLIEEWQPGEVNSGIGRALQTKMDDLVFAQPGLVEKLNEMIKKTEALSDAIKKQYETKTD